MYHMRLGPDGLLASANVSILFQGHAFDERLRMAREAGFGHVEAWWPFESPFPDDAEVDQMLGRLTDEGLQLTGLNFYAGDMPVGERGVVSHPALEATFREHVVLALDIARRAGCERLNALYGNSSPTPPRKSSKPWRCATTPSPPSGRVTKGRRCWSRP